MTDAKKTGPATGLLTPQSTLLRFAECVRERDLDSLVALYEPDAVFSPEPTIAVKGHDGIRHAFTELFGINPSFEFVLSYVHESGGLALVANNWTLSGTAPDGSAISKSGRSAVVMRRSSKGNWLIVIDKP